MGSVKVTVYGRIKPCLKSSQEYKVKYGDEEDQITFINSRLPSRRSFRFKKIFGEDATQEQVFETVAKPVIKNFFAGYNGTIFTYGQTGSGKTYTMTGDIEEWLDPGLIPRIVQEIFKTKRLDTIVTITFCEIYNEHIYDLIRTDRTESEPPAISMVTEANSGITNFRNLTAHKVKTAEEALQLFLRGDANKMVAETGSNFRSSRSHAIFSIGLEFPHPTQENLRLKPVLYLVDLAGSEKLSKCKTPMSNVSETRYINLSLHYLEQVLIALRQPGRAHIPYRNSLMTALLRNSLGGNSITVMIATFSVSREDAEETTQTCRFAERIALIKNDVKLIELVSPEKEIDYLKKENERLRAQLKLVCNEQIVDQLDEKEKEKCIEAVRNFIQDNDYFELPLTNVRRMEYCFRIMRDEILKDKDFIECKDIKSKDSQLEPPKKIIADISEKFDFLKSSDLIEKSGDKLLFQTLEFDAIFKAVKSNKSIKSIKSVKSIKSIRSIKSVRNIKSDDSQRDLLQDKVLFTNKSLIKKSSAEIPKVNIIYEESMWKEDPEGHQLNSSDYNEQITITGKENKEISTPKNNKEMATNKVRFSNISRDSNDLKVKNSNQLKKIYSQNKLKDGLNSCNIKKEKDSGPCARRNNSSIKLQSPSEKNKELNNYVSPTLPPTTVTSMTLTEETKDKSLVVLDNEEVHMEEEINSETDIQYQREEILRKPSSLSNEFKAFTAKCVPLTGDKEVDEEIIKFYKSRYQIFKNK